MHRRSLGAVVVVLGAIAVGACEGTTTGGDGGNNSGGAGAGVGAGSAAGGAGASSGESFTVVFDPVTVAPGEENTQCIVKRIGNDAQIRVHEITNVLPTGSHHLIVYRTEETEEQLTPFDCRPFADTLDASKGSPVMITQKSEETLTLPEGVGFTFEAGAVVRLEMHYINTGGAPLDVSATTQFTTMAEDAYRDEASFLFVGNPDISIPPSASATLGPTFFQLPANLQSANFFGITGHTHQWGTNVSVATAASESGSDTSVYDVDNWQWSEPETVYHDPPFSIPAGGGFRFTCSWDNQSNSSVGFGESANQEMCFFWAYYYPSVGPFVCAHTDQVGSGLDICCPGSPLCGQLF